MLLTTVNNVHLLVSVQNVLKATQQVLQDHVYHVQINVKLVFRIENVKLVNNLNLITIQVKTLQIKENVSKRPSRTVDIMTPKIIQNVHNVILFINTTQLQTLVIFNAILPVKHVIQQHRKYV